MKDLIRQILREESKKQKFNASSQLMDMLIKGYEWVSDNEIMALYNEEKSFVILYVKQTIDGGKISLSHTLTDSFMRYLGMTYSEVNDFISKWCYEVLGFWVDYGNVYEFSKNEGERMAKRFD
jgi:hypothetical protein